MAREQFVWRDAQQRLTRNLPENKMPAASIKTPEQEKGKL